MFDLNNEIGIKSWSFREIKENPACADAVEPASWQAVKDAYTGKGIAISGIGAAMFKPDEAWNRRFFEFAKFADAKLVSLTFAMEDWEKSLASIEKLTEEYGIPAAIHNHGGYNWLGNSTALSYIFKRSTLIKQVSTNTSHAIRHVK